MKLKGGAYEMSAECLAIFRNPQNYGLNPDDYSNLNFEEFDFSSYDYYEKHGQMMPNDWKEKISNHDAIFLEL